MAKWSFALPVAATVAAICLNKEGFWAGGPREGWELVVTLGYLLCWSVFFRRRTTRWQRIVSRVWWVAVTICTAVCFCVTAFDLDGFLLILPAIVFVTPMSGLVLCTGTNYPEFYGWCTILAIVFLICTKYWPDRDSGKEA